jgi:hypothetical protein
MRGMILGVVASAMLVAGCQSIRVQVDCRLTPDSSLWNRLNGPDYVIHGVSPEVESSLEFQDFAGLMARTLELIRPSMRRVAIGQPANLQMSLTYAMFYRGQAIETYPVHEPVWGFGPYGYGMPFDTYVGTEVQTVDLGYQHTISVSAWISDPGQVGGRKVLWEGRASEISDSPTLRQPMPHMLVALFSFYGEATDGLVTVKLEKDDMRLKALAGAPIHGHKVTSHPAGR